MEGWKGLISRVERVNMDVMGLLLSVYSVLGFSVMLYSGVLGFSDVCMLRAWVSLYCIGVRL